MRLWVGGVYDKTTLNTLSNIDVRNIIFDFRPRSFNFVQEYKMQEILENEIHENSQIGLCFESEKAFIIDKIFNDLENKSYITKEQILLFLEGIIEKATREHYLYYWKYDQRMDLNDLLQDDNCLGIVLDQVLLDSLNQSQQLYQFMSKLIKSNKEIVVESSKLPTGLLDFFKIDSLILPLNKEWEVGYRQVDQDLLDDYLRRLQAAAGAIR
jgi:hypothetical protein